METIGLERISATEWRLPARGAMRVPAVFHADEGLLRDMDDRVAEQLANVATLPGIVSAAYAMPDAHWGYGFPIGGVAAFDPDEGGVISVGGVGFDISCGVRLHLTDLNVAAVRGRQRELADLLFARIPCGVGVGGAIHLDQTETDAMLSGGARWAVERGYGSAEDLPRIEEAGCMAGAEPSMVSLRARRRQRDEMGSLGSGNHYLEVQQVSEVFDPRIAAGYGLDPGAVVVSIHCGSRGLGHQIGTEFLAEMGEAMPNFGILVPDRELACAPIASELGRRYLGAMRAGINCALANREILGHLMRATLAELFGPVRAPLLFDVSHNTCKVERHLVDGVERRLHVHRKGATRAFAPGHPDLPEDLRPLGQPVLIGGSMGTASFVLAGMQPDGERAFGSACHGAGRRMSRHEATRRWRGRDVSEEMERRGILVRSPTARGVAEEAPGAYKDVEAVVAAAEAGGLARRVARLEPLVCIKG